ncbi:hypothetical protein C2E23DRAFT_866755 [Lenzites betulinus]|nr:hypothetical protein C2E23DRAFT_866755 [Lenzites betulinus]
MSSLFQNSFYVVNNINAILYGIELVLYFMTLRQIALNKRKTTMDKFLVVFSTVLLLLNTIYWTTQTYFGQMMWVKHADYPGGMDAYLADNVAVWYQTWGSAAVDISNLMADALMIYRLYVIWDNRLIAVFPAMIWLGALASALGSLYESGRPNGNYFAGVATKFGTSWNALTLSFNVIVTCLISGRIIYIGRRLGAGNEGTQTFTGAAAIIIESALPFTIGSLIYVITYGIGSDIAVAFSCYAMFTAISPQLIALRVLSRRAWRKESMSSFMTTINFEERTNATATHPGDPQKVNLKLEKRRDEVESSMNFSTVYGASAADLAV